MAAAIPRGGGVRGGDPRAYAREQAARLRRPRRRRSAWRTRASKRQKRAARGRRLFGDATNTAPRGT